MDKIVSILWHMHQPCYRDKNGEYVMPWVFTHAIKDYFDMPYIALQNGVKVTFNLVPSLIIQLKDYSNFEINDRFLKYIKKKERSEYENEFILSIIKSTPFTLLNKFPRFSELLNSVYLDIELMNDLEVFFLLAHCGDYLRRNSDIVKELLNKSSFSWEEKISLLKELHKFVSKIIPFYKSAYLEGKIELSTTPFYHPIIPLLLDVNAAENLKKPALFANFKDDAKLQIERALELFEREFGKRPDGLWPSEGSVSTEALELFNEYGLKWIATDEDILHKTNPALNPSKVHIFKNLKIIFRNKFLSDSIGFRYRFMSVEDALNDFNHSLNDVNIIIMDGENAWEYYPDPTEFLHGFYRETRKHRVLTLSEIAEEPSLRGAELENIAPGSWIGANFSIWIGDEEKNKAWELLSRAKISLDEQPNSEAHELLLVDEGSDWFWWYGETNYTKHKKLYDYLFKSRIAEIYKLLNKPLDDIKSFIISEEDRSRPPVSYIEPSIDGKERFFEYANAGYIEVKSSAIHVEPIVKGIKYGYDEKGNLYLAIFLKKIKNITLKINGIIYPLKKGIHDNYAVDKIVEIKLPLCDRIELEVMEGDKVLQNLSFDVKPINFTWIA